MGIYLSGRIPVGSFLNIERERERKEREEKRRWRLRQNRDIKKVFVWPAVKEKVSLLILVSVFEVYRVWRLR